MLSSPFAKMSDVIAVNNLDRMLSFFQAMSNRPLVGDTFYQGDNMPQIFFVSSDDGSDSNDGRDPRTPLATLGQALDAVSANRGDIIYLMPGHAETYTADFDVDVAGVTIIGLGIGADRPTFTIGDAVGESFDFTAASCLMSNCIFTSGIDAQTAMVRILAADVTIVDCEFREATSIQPLIMLDITGASANDCDRAQVINCVFKNPTAGDGDTAIELGEVADGVVIAGCTVFGDYDDACIHNPTGKVLTNLLISDCLLTNLLTGQHSIELVSACTGNLVRNLYNNDMTQATGVDPGACRSFECYHDDAVDVSGILAPAAT